MPVPERASTNYTPMMPQLFPSEIELPNGRDSDLVFINNWGLLPTEKELAEYEKIIKNTRTVIKKHFSNSVELAHIFQEKKLREYEESIKRDRIEKEKNEIYLYLMIDKRNGYYKIGKSGKPKKREKTLQSEVPEISMVFHAKIVSETTSESFFHKKFNEKRIRGEWFALTESEVKFIQESFKP